MSDTSAEQRDKAVQIGIDAFARIEVLENLIRDGLLQFPRLTGPNLELYAKTWAALAGQTVSAHGQIVSVGEVAQ